MSVVYLSTVQLGGAYSGQAPAVTAYQTTAGAAPTTTFPSGVTASVGTPWESVSSPGTYGVAITLSGRLPAGALLYVGWSVGGLKVDDAAPQPAIGPGSPRIVAPARGTRSFQPGDAFGALFLCLDASGALADADALPSASVYRAEAQDGAVAVTVARVSTGLYRATGTYPSGYSAGDRVSVLAAAAIGGVATAAVIDDVRLLGYPCTGVVVKGS